MNDLDDKLREALKPDGTPGADDESLHEMIAQTFRGRNRWITVMVYIYIFAFAAVGAVAAVMFFRAGEAALADKIMYASLFVSMVVFVGLLKMYIWMLMNRNSITREVKRLELRIDELRAELRRQ